MAEPTYRCPYKVNATTNEGIVCENNDCAAYDADDEHCTFVMVAQQQKKVDNLTVPNNA